jgi:Na+/pantothenate symporter
MSGCSLGSSALFAVSASNTALLTFLLYTLAVFGIAAVSNRLLRGKNFLSEYFLGSRSLGMWAFALTFAATSSSGGSFTGFPSKIYTHGWILGLWIGSYTVVPICAMGLLGKRLNQVARISGAITVSDVLRDRMHSALFGLLATVLIVFFMSFNLVAQFKAGGEILNTLLLDVPLFNTAAGWMSGVQSRVDFLHDVNSAYLLCLIAFAISVIVYTTYGGFHAVVWTDVMQGVVMVVGVIIMLPLAIWEVGGLGNATRQMADMTPPRLGLVEFALETPLAESYALPSPWFTLPGDDGPRPRLFRVSRSLAIPAGQTTVSNVRVVEIATPEEIDKQLKRLSEPGEIEQFRQRIARLKKLQIQWLQKKLEDRPADRGVLGVRLQQLQDEAGRVATVGEALLNAPELGAMTVTISLLKDYKYGSDQPGVYVTGPGPDPPQLPRTAADEPPAKDQNSQPQSNGFLPLSLAISFFFMWAISGAGQPSSMVRLMAFNNTRTLRRAIFTVAIYYSLIYFPLVVIFCCARVMLPGMDLESDRIMPQMAVTLTNNIGHGWLAGLLIAAPFAAVMSTVDSFLLMTSSALVRDIYQRNINPEASQRTIKRLSYLFTLAVGAGAMLGAIKPPMFLQDIIVYTGSGLAACFLGPMVFALYWPRANAAGCIAGMLAGFLSHLSMYVGGIFANGSFYKPYQIFNFDPIIVGLFVSFATVLIVSKLTPPPPEDLVRKYFYRQKPSTAKN